VGLPTTGRALADQCAYYENCHNQAPRYGRPAQHRANPAAIPFRFSSGRGSPSAVTVRSGSALVTPGDVNARRDHEYEHLDAMLEEFAALQYDDPRRRVLRDRLVLGFRPVVENIARRYRGRGEAAADLEQAGMIGLLNALDRFEPHRGGGGFLPYLVPTVTGEIRRHFRDRSWPVRVSRRLKDIQGPIRDAAAALSHELHRAPRPSEIAARLGVETDEVIEGLRAQDLYHTSSLDALGTRDARAVDETLGRVDAALEKVEYRQALRGFLDDLPERERKILVLRFFGELTQTQIAGQIGISQMQVSRLLSQTLALLRRRLTAE
jgi:RNA polymerase sigma-B factor